MPTDEIILGVDLGTTFSVAAYVDDQGTPRVIPNAEGEKTTPSVALIDGDEIQVGAIALNQAITRRDHVVRWIKRSMGDLDFRIHGLGPIEISAAILRKIKTDAEAALGVPLSKAVITCPAYFSAIEVESTMKAGLAAGLEVREIVREPTAAAVYYGVEHLQEGGTLLVCDLGGGTYDASILRLEAGVFKPLATAGDRQLGGHDWTADLLEHVAELLTKTFGEDPRSDAATEQTLYDACERVKRDFARSEQGTIACVYKGRAAQVALARRDFERLTDWRIQQMLTWTEKALAKADPPLMWPQIDQILLVGGATRMRRVQESIAERSGKQPIQTAEADTIVALGAAILAKGAYRPRRATAGSGIKKHAVSGLTLINFTRTAPRNLGTRVIKRDGQAIRIENSVIIPYGAELPIAQTREDYQSSMAGQAFFDIPVVEFDDIGSDAIQNTWRFDCPPELPQGAPIHVTFSYDQSGQIDVQAIEYRTGAALAKRRVPYEEPDLQSLKLIATPRAVVFVLDVSGSMSEHGKIVNAKQALIDNARDLLQLGGGQTQIGVVAFGSRAEVLCPLTADLQAINAAVVGASTYGTTAMGAGIALALNMLAQLPPDVVREVVLVSDGMPDRPDEAMSAGARAHAQGVRLCLLGLQGEGVDADFLRQLTPVYLMIEDAEGISRAIASLLTQAAPPAAQRSGITWLGGQTHG